MVTIGQTGGIWAGIAVIVGSAVIAWMVNAIRRRRRK
jgi:hypothetical protein